MPTEAELRDLMHGDDDEPGALDTARIIRKAKARRRPKQLAAGLAGGVAAAGALALVLPMTLGLGGGGSASTAGGSAADEAPASEDASTLKSHDGAESAALATTATTLQMCGAPLADVAPDAGGLVLTVAPVDAPVDASWIETTVTLTNTGNTPVKGTTAGTVAVTMSADGIVLWHSNGPQAPNDVGVDLEPGESLSYSGTFRPVRCSPDDETLPDGFPAELPPVEPGSYQLSAAIDLVPLDGTATRLVTGPATTITLR